MPDWTYDGRTYTFRKIGGLYAPIRDDGRMSYSVFASYDITPAGVTPIMRAHPNLFGTVREAKAFVSGENVSTYVGFVQTWALDAQEATTALPNASLKEHQP